MCGIRPFFELVRMPLHETVFHSGLSFLEFVYELWPEPRFNRFLPLCELMRIPFYETKFRPGLASACCVACALTQSNLLLYVTKWGCVCS